MKEEFRRIKKISKEVLGRESYRKAKRIKDYSERTEGLKHLMHSKLHLILLDIEHKIEGLPKKEQKILDPKLIRLRSKIKIFDSTQQHSDYKVFKKLVKDIEEDIKNV